MLFEAFCAIQGQSTLGKLVVLADGITANSLLAEVLCLLYGKNAVVESGVGETDYASERIMVAAE